MPATSPDPAPAVRSRSSIRSLLRLWPYVRPVRARLGLSAAVAVVASCTALLIPLVLKWMVGANLALPVSLVAKTLF